MRFARLTMLTLALGAGCGGANPGGARPSSEPLLPLELDRPVQGDTHDDDGWHLGACTGGGTAGVHSARAYRFVAPATGSYRVEAEAGYRAVVDVSEADSERRTMLGCFGVGEGERDGVSVPMRAGGEYVVVVDGRMQARGPYALVVRRDDGPDAPIRPEDPDVIRAACARAPTLPVGGEVAGTFASSPGGLRASCGGTGSQVTYRLEVPEGGGRLELAAHFAPLLEVRRGCDGERLVCVAPPPGEFHVALDAPLPRGRYVVVVDTSDVVDDPPDERVGAGVLGAYWLRAAAAEDTP